MTAVETASVRVGRTERPADGAVALSAGSLLVGVLNYATSLVAVHLLAPESFGSAAAAQAVLLVVGTAATASVPWVVAQVLERPTTTARGAREVVWFSLVVNVLQGVVAAVSVFLVTRAFLDEGAAAIAALAALLVFLTTTPAGWLQGRRRFLHLAGLRVLEAVVKVVVVVVLLRGGSGAGGVVVGVAAGAAAALVVGLVLCREDLGRVAGAFRLKRLWRSSWTLLAVQAQVAALVALDVLLVETVVPTGTGGASYQAAAVLGKMPLFVAGALAAVEFGRLTRGASDVGRQPPRVTAVDALLLLCLPLVVLAATAPPELLRVVVPPAYVAVPVMLPAAAALGSALAVLTLACSCCVALGVDGTARRLTVLLMSAALVGTCTAFLAGPAVAAWALAAVVAAGAWWLARPVGALLAPRGGAVAAAGALSVFTGAVALALAGRPLAWLAAALLTGVVAGGLALRALRAAAPDEDAAVGTDRASRRPSVLHLAFEDHRRPGAGGGSRRSLEVNSRLSEEFDITVVTTTWRGAADRVEDGVRYRHVGVPGGYLVEVLSYFAMIPFVLRRSDADLVVEDFAAPFSTVGVQRWTRRPVVGVVQWLNAQEKSRQYRLPLHRVERAGVRRHTRLLAVSEGVARRLRELNPRADVRVLPNGVEPEALCVTGPRGPDVLFLGRLEIAQKGLDVLLEAWSTVHDRMPGRLLIAGDGPDAAELERLVERRGVRESVTFLGRVDPGERLALLRSARLTVMPSRFETFGLVALESQAVGTPVVATDIDCLRDVVVPGPGVLVPVDDVGALAAAVLEVATDTGWAGRHEATARAWASGFTWDSVARAQGEVLRSAL